MKSHLTRLNAFCAHNAHGNNDKKNEVEKEKREKETRIERKEETKRAQKESLAHTI